MKRLTSAFGVSMEHGHPMQWKIILSDLSSSADRVTGYPQKILLLEKKSGSASCTRRIALMWKII